MAASSSENIFVQCTKSLRPLKGRKEKSRRAKTKNIGKWDYITRKMPYVLLTDVMKQYVNNENIARNSESSKNQQRVEACTALPPSIQSSIQIVDKNILKDVTNKQIITSYNSVVNDGKPLTIRLISDRLMCETDSDALVTSPLSCVRDCSENLISYVTHDVINTVCTNDIDERTNDDQTEYCFDKQNKLLEGFTDIDERTNDDQTEYCFDKQNKLLEENYTDHQNYDSRKYLDSTTHNEDSGSEYCPEHSFILAETDANDDVSPDAANKKRQSSESKTDSKNTSGFEISVQANENNAFCPDDINLKIDPSNGPKGDNKKNCCFYCHKMQSKIARHLGTVHRNEPDVKKFLDLPPYNLERKKIIETLRRNGNFIHNTNSNVNDGKLVVCRRPRKDKQKGAKDYTACAKCKGFFVKSSIRRHFSRCTGYSSKQHRSVMVMGRAIIGRIHPIAEEKLRKVVFPVLREDEITRIIRFDELIITYGNRLCRKYPKEYQHKLIRSHLRYLGRFLKTMRDINVQVTSLESTYHPAFYEDCIRAVNKMSAFDSNTNTYKVTTTPQLMGTLLKKVGNLLITQSIKKKDYETKNDTEEFLALLIDDFPTSVNKAALEAQEENKRSKKTELPSMNDIVKLRDYLDEKRETLYEILKETFCPNSWLELAKVTLTSVQLFNRRRSGEIEHLLVKDFKNYVQISESTDKDLFQSLSGKAREIAKKYVRFTIRGKLMRTVPVLLSAQLLKCIEIILKYRDAARVPTKNIYLFGIAGYNKNCFKFLNACELMRRFSTECGAERPWTLRGTGLRKHVATISVALDLSENDVSDLAKHMGHAITIHKEIYRQPIISRDIVRMSQVLEKAQGVNNDNSDETDNDENCENSENNINLSHEIEAELYGTTNNNSPSLNTKRIYGSAKKQNSIHGNKEHSMHDTNPNDSDTESDSSINDDSQFLNVKGLTESTHRSAKKRNTPPYGRTRRIRWTNKEKQLVMKHFGDYMKEAKLPSIKAIQEIIAKNPCLQNRSASVVKTWINNQQRSNGTTERVVDFSRFPLLQIV